MIRSSRRAVLAATLLLTAAVLLGLATVASAQESRDCGERARLPSAGDLEDAVEAGKRAFETLKAERLDLPAAKSIERRIKAIEDAKTLVVYKLNAIAESAGAGTKSLFLYTAPSPEQLLSQVKSLFYDSRVSYDGLSEREAENLGSYLCALLQGADTEVIDAYGRTAAAQLDERGHSEARSYLIAYVGGAREGYSYNSVLALLAEVPSDDITPYVLVQYMLTVLRSPKTAWEVFVAVDEANGWDRDERSRLLTLVIERGRDLKQYDAAADVYRFLARQDGKAAEDAQRTLIKMYANDAEDFEQAIVECDVYLSRFRDGKGSVQVEFLKALYMYKARQFETALAEVAEFSTKHPNSICLPNAIMLQGLSSLALGKEDEAIDCFEQVAKRHPAHKQAAKAEFLRGTTLLHMQMRSEALDAFQRVVDFYPDDSSAPRAKRYLEKLHGMDGVSEQGTAESS